MCHIMQTILAASDLPRASAFQCGTVRLALDSPILQAWKPGMLGKVVSAFRS